MSADPDIDKTEDHDPKTFFGRWDLIAASGLRPQSRWILIVISKFTGNGEWCWASRKTIGEHVGFGEVQLRKYLAELRAQRLIVERRQGRGRTTLTRINNEELVALVRRRKTDTRPSVNEGDTRPSVQTDTRPSVGTANDRHTSVALKTKRKKSGKVASRSCK